jgi:methionyl-tRNA formyltransferase
LNLIFAGTPAFAAQALDALLGTHHKVSLVLSRTDKPSGRGQQLSASPVKQRALQAGLPVLQPRTLKPGLRDESHLDALREVGADLMIVAAYGLILPVDVLSIPRLGCLNIHASLLPRWRGAAPIQRAIEAGDAQTGITIMQMDEGLDTGAMRLIRPLEIRADETASSLHDRLATLGAQAIVEAMDLLERQQLPSRPQPEDGVCFAHKIEKSESSLDWSLSAQVLEQKIRALDPFPGCVTQFKGVPLKIWAARALTDSALAKDSSTDTGSMPGVSPGQIVEIDQHGLQVQTGKGRLRILALQKPGGKRLDIKPFLAGAAITVGDRFE